MIEEKCCICEASFRPSAMIGNKCKSCHEKHPDLKGKEELQKEAKTKFIAELINEEVMKRMVYDILEEAGIKREKCSKCEKLYFKRSPAQKVCSDCKES